MHNPIQINYWTIGGFDGAKPIPQALAEAREMGCDGLELTFGAGCFAPGITADACRGIREEAQRLGLQIATLASGHFWGESFSHPKASVRRSAIAFAKEYLVAAQAVGAKAVLVIPGAVAVPWDPGQPIVPYATVWRRVSAAVHEILPLARRLRVKLALENVWNGFLTDPMAMKQFVDQFQSRYVGVYFDVANCVINGYPEHWIAILGRRIAAVHFKNFARTDCAGGLHGFGDDLLTGDVRWPAVLEALQRIRYQGPITAEMLPFSRLPDMVLPDMDLARKTVAQLRQLVKGA